MKRLLFILSPFRASGLALLCVGLILVAMAVWIVFFNSRTEHVYSLTLSLGKRTKTPKSLTRFIMDRAAEHQLIFELVSTEGSEDTLGKVERDEVNVAVVKGGLALPKDTNVRQVAALDLELFHLLVKEPLAPAVEKNIASLKGKRININTPHTGTHHWSKDILQFAGLRAIGADGKGDYTPVMLGNPEMEKLLEAIKNASEEERARLIDELPDAILLADLVPAPLPAAFVQHANYRLVPLDFGTAYVQYFHASEHTILDPAAPIETAGIPAYSYGVAVPVPKQACATLGVRRLMVANKNVPAPAVVRCLRLLYDKEPNTSLTFAEWSKFRPQFPPHEGVRLYDEERRQVLQNTIIKLVERLASVLGGIIGGILAIYGYFRYRRLLRFEHYFHEIRRIELIARGKLADPEAPAGRPERLDFLLGKLSDLRTAAIAEFARGRLQGESLILSIFTLIQDTSNYVRRVLGETIA